jgi:hypothetical protein
MLRPNDGTVRFKSACPKCGKWRTQRYEWSGLLRLLNGGYPVEAYCAACEECRPISLKERVRLGQVTVGGRPHKR